MANSRSASGGILDRESLSGRSGVDPGTAYDQYSADGTDASLQEHFINVIKFFLTLPPTGTILDLKSPLNIL